VLLEEKLKEIAFPLLSFPPTHSSIISGISSKKYRSELKRKKKFIILQSASASM
jgi:hypothetical protein